MSLALNTSSPSRSKLLSSFYPQTHPTEFPDDLSSMYSARSLCLLLLWAVLVREGAGVISGPRSPRDRGQLEPRTVDAAEGEDPFELLEKGARRLHKRQSSSNSSGIGTTSALSGDGHNQAVVHWTGYPSERIFIVTRQRIASGRSAPSRESWLWRSKDYGHHFENETYKLGDSDAVIQWYYISPMQNNLIFADTTNQRLYITTDEGESYTRVDIPFVPDRLLFQSSLSPNVTEDFPLYVLGYDASNRTLWVSSDLGSTWTLLGENVTAGRYYWRVMNATIEGNLTTVYFETAINSTHAQLHYSVYPYSSHDTFDPSLEPFLINTFVLAREYMFVQMNASTGGDYQSPLWVSHYRKPFRQARFPLQTAERHYSVVDASEGQVFIAVYHSFNNTNLYLSEEQGLNYSLSLEYIISPPESDWVNGYPAFDVHVVEGIVGTYIANRKTPGSQYGATVISFDKGGIWTFLTPPAVTSGGAPIICSLPQCSLHLHMNSDRVYGYQSILSQDSAVGLIMAQGNIGAALQRYNYNIQRLYFSHDGGYTWQEVAQGFWQFQFAALGSIVVTVHMYQRGGVDNVRWTCDEGASWNETSFVDSSIRVVGMLTERGEKARHVTVFGSTPTGAFEWLVVDLNFSSVVPDQCTYPQDYYEWIPTERRGSRCLLGEVIIYERRKSEECCFVDPEYDKPTVRSTCECTIEDFECDFGFERVNLNSECRALPFINYPPPPPTDCQEGGNYNYSSGYRRVAEDVCVPGDDNSFLPIVKECPAVAPKGLFLLYSPLQTPPGVNVTFTLTQLEGWRMTTEYRWYFNDSTAVRNVTGYSDGHIQSHVFPSHGTYHVSVTVSNAAGSSQAFTGVVVVERIRGIEVDARPTVRSAILTTVSVTVHTEGGELYNGPLRLTAQHQNGTELDSNYWENTNGNEQLHIALSNPGNSNVMFTASNGVFVQSNTTVFLVVSPGQYGAVTLVFRTADLPANHDTPEWKKEFVNSIIGYIQQHYGLSVQLIEVESLRYYDNVTLETSSVPSVEHRVLKRSGETLLAVEVNLLPASSRDVDISTSITVAEQLVSQIQSGAVMVTVGNQTVAVANASLRSTQQIVIVEPTTAVQNTKLYIGLGLGLGLGLIALVVFSAVMVVVTYHYRKKYSRLQVRYSRLQQGPVRFTFTEHGETVEEEDFADNFSDDDPTYADDKKLEKIAPLPGAMES